MGDAQKSAVASFDRCWEPWVPVLYFMARRWYKRASNLSRAGITISKPRKARHRCGQISGWHRFTPLLQQSTILSLIEIKGRTDTPGTIFSLPAIFPHLFLSLHEASFRECGIIVSLAGFSLNPACQLPWTVLSSSVAFKKKPTLPPSSTSNISWQEKKCLEVF